MKTLVLCWLLIHSKLKIYFSFKDKIPDDLKSFLVYKFTGASCIGVICCHFKTRIEKQIKKDKN